MDQEFLASVHSLLVLNAFSLTTAISSLHGAKITGEKRRKSDHSLVTKRT